MVKIRTRDEIEINRMFPQKIQIKDLKEFTKISWEN